MKLKKVRIVVQDIESVKDRWKNALKGKAFGEASKSEIIVLRLDAVAKIFLKKKENSKN
jgi:hypothetical protein